MTQDAGGDFDRVLTFTIPDRDARGRAVRLGPLLQQVLSAHDYPPVLSRLLGEALVLTALMGTLLKDDGSQLTVQAQSEGGAVDLLVCDYRDGELRGYVRHDPEMLGQLSGEADLPALFGKGYLAITFDLAMSDQRYQGVVPLEGASLAQACQNYFLQSEQVPTLIRIGVAQHGGEWVAGGYLVQHLPEGEEGRERLHARMDHPHWEHVAALASSLRVAELTDGDLTLEDLTWRLFHEESEVRVSRGDALRRGCRCTVAHYHAILSRFGPQELDDMRDEQGVISVDCAFCSRVFPIEI
ncbi:Hsp33 family molecular chaperone HslO [Novosphingobium sp. FSY-8]|uniref:Hsp33 family molecular chaperone HslO n=1 Tax=Novosphingobium ovatum TaxID=1908523 RepID=A0ABW9XGV8_9SPHN|nr:Hsp33 family molecular chaperone HslO [Novosphingobium ovatum]NBC37703.1 Hsp33 family molecular chaperone HslO [Novosphingobium ovatum]